jgi:hypothetical protein
MVSEMAGNARKGIAGASKVSKASLGHLASYARYATHIRKFSPTEGNLPDREIKLREPLSMAKSICESGGWCPESKVRLILRHRLRSELWIRKDTSEDMILVWFRFRSSLEACAAKMKRTSEPPH